MKYDEINRALRGMAESVARRMEMDKTHRFTFYSSTSYTDMDGDSVTTTVGDGLALTKKLAQVKSFLIDLKALIMGNNGASKPYGCAA